MNILAFRMVIVGLFVAVMGGGCVTSLDVRPLSNAEVTDVQKSKNTIVFLRYTVRNEGELARLPEDPWVTFAKIDEGEAPSVYYAHVAPFFAPTPEARQAGWMYAILPPGTYYFYAGPPTTYVYHLNLARFGTLSTTEPRTRGAFWHPSGVLGFLLEGTPPLDFTVVPGFWFNVPESMASVYVGSLSVSCREMPGTFAADQCSEFQISDETELAKNVAGAAFSGLPEMKTRLMGHLGMPVGGTDLTGLFPMELRIIGVDEVKEAEFAGGRARPVSVIHGTGPAAGIFNIFSALSVLSRVESEEEEAAKAHAKWGPCFGRLSEALHVENSTALLHREIESALGRNIDGRILRLSDDESISNAVQRGAKSTLDTRLLNIGLRECGQNGKFCMEVVLRARVRDLSTGTYVYDAVLAYTNTYPPLFNPNLYAQRMYHVPTPELSTCRSLDVYCADSGVALLEEEVAKGIEYIARKLIQDLTGIH